MPDGADITIIGAGVVGLAVASRVVRQGRKVYVLEKNGRPALDQSSRNSQVVHAGIYYEKDSLKARMCLEGNALLYELCENNGIPYRKCGKIIVAVNEVEAREMEKLYKRAQDNGVLVKMLSQWEMKELEPNMKGVAAFLCPTSGVVDSHALVRYFLGKAQEQGAQVVYRTEVTGIEKASDGFNVKVKDVSGSQALATRVLINCAGLYGDKVAEMAGIDIDKANYRLHYCKGEFYSVRGAKNKLVNRLIYPVPMNISVGAHVCLDVNWRLRLGPLFYYVDEIGYKVEDSMKERLLNSSIMKALPFIEPSDLEPESSGIMAMLQGEGEGFRDFVIRHEADKGLSGFINLVGIESPGLTSSPAIAGYVSRVVGEVLS